MRNVCEMIERVAPTDATVLIQGETGTGKELVARALHRRSPRRDRPFVAVNCSAIPRELLESEFFGHEKGSFTGATARRVGRFEQAEGSTLFLDEVGELDQSLQAKLLRVLQEREFTRIGATAPTRADVRIVAASNRDLAALVQDGRFRDDLYYRLRVLPIEIAPLRQRREDIEPLALGLLARVGARQSRALRLSPEALKVLLDYDWPGNVRELENVLEYAVAVCQGQTILPENLPELVPAVHPPHDVVAPAPEAGPTLTPVVRRPSPVATIDRDALQRTLQAHRWRRADAARALGVSRSTLWRWIREAGLE
jgi:DNA-binding NtrC family response regulator